MSALSAISPDTPNALTCEAQCDAAEWDEFVRTHPDGTFFHLSGWGEATKAAYGYETFYLIARRNGAIEGALPLCHVRTPLLGASLVSTAFTVGGGPLATNDEALNALLGAATKIGVEKKVRFVECRSQFKAEGWLSKSGLHATFDMPLLKDEREALSSVPRKRRADLRKAIDAANTGALTIRHDGEPELFHKLYAHSLHRLGTPVFSKGFLRALLDAFHNETEISVVEYKGEPVAALLSFYFKGAVLPYYVGATDKAREVRAFDYIYWAAMRRAAKKGCMRFDFGRSKVDSGAYAYKKLWGLEPRPLAYHIKLVGDDALPEINASNPKFAVFSKLWPQLPGFAVNRLGPMLAPNFP